MQNLIPIEHITEKIYFIRGVKVMLDRDLAKLYEVETRALKQAVRRNKKRFPSDFMIELTKEEFKNWRSQIVISNNDKIGLRHPPMAFSELGVAMLSSVLKSEKSVQMNIQIMRAFTQLRKIALNHSELKAELEKLRKQTDERFQIVFETLDQILSFEEKPKRQIGF